MKITYKFGAIFSNYQGGMEITADPQNCGSCTWAQVVSRTGTGALARIIHESPDTEGLICYKHVVKTVFEAEKEAFA